MKLNNSAFGLVPKTSLHQTVTGGRQETTEELSTLGNIRMDTTELLKAMQQRNVTKAKELLKHCNHVNAVDHKKQTLLHKALLFKTDVQIVKELLWRGADIRATDHNGNTPLHLAFYRGVNVAGVRELLHHGADTEALNNHGDSPLCLGAKHGAIVEYVEELLKYETGEVADCWNLTPLLNALSFETDLKIVKGLLANGADISIFDSTGTTPLNRAMNDLPIAKMLVKHTLMHKFIDDSSNFYNLNVQSGNYGVVKRYIEKCIFELVKMKTIKVNRTSLYVFATTKNSNTPLYLENSPHIITQEGKLVANYPIYSDIILPRAKYALGRGTLLRKLYKVCIYSRNSHGLFKSIGVKVTLNYDCAYRISRYLCNDNLCNLILSFYDSNLNDFESHPTGLAKNKFVKRFLEAPARNWIKKARLR